MKRRLPPPVKLLALCVIAGLFIPDLLFALHSPGSRLFIKNLNFCTEKPRGIGRFTPAGEGFKLGDDVYLYAEAENCKSEREGKGHHLNLVLDMDIYYEDGRPMYSQKDVKSFAPNSMREFSKTFLWVKIETRYLQAGEYKVEINVRDENAKKSALTLGKFKVY